jgi:tRNA uridine 5-carboxymethylaminomethyl modification enzyme
MPLDVQLRMVRSMAGFENAEILRHGYAIEYDVLDPLQLDSALAVSGMSGLWAAGQINGTTGYEEAAGQGFVAGVNAVRYLRNEPPFVVSRSEAYLGVMIDDIVTKGVDEPYRMLTARAERRLDLAADLADERLLEKAKSIGILNADEIAAVERRAEWRKSFHRACESSWVKKTSEYARFAEGHGPSLNHGMTVAELLKRQQVEIGRVDEILAEVCRNNDISCEGMRAEQERDALLFAVRYSGYREREARLLGQVEQWESISIPASLLESDISGLSIEVREKLRRHRPQTLGQASRIPGITNAAVALLHLLIEKDRRN